MKRSDALPSVSRNLQAEVDGNLWHSGLQPLPQGQGSFRPVLFVIYLCPPTPMTSYRLHSFKGLRPLSGSVINPENLQRVADNPIRDDIAGS